MIATLIAGGIIILLSNRFGHWLDTLPGDPGYYEWDMTTWGIFIAGLFYLIMDHL